MVPASYWLGCELHRCRRGAGLASIPKASFLDASETIKGLYLHIAAPKQVCELPSLTLRTETASLPTFRFQSEG